MQHKTLEPHAGSDVLDKYELKAANTPFRFFIMPVTKDTDIAKAARAAMPVAQPVNVQRQANGAVKMTTATKNATIYYSIDGGEYKKYVSAFANSSACEIKAYCEAADLLPSLEVSYTLDAFVNRASWKVVSVDSQHGGNEAAKVFDNNNSTFWHTEYSGSEPACPHTLVIDMVKSYKVTAFTYLPRQDGSENGMVISLQMARHGALLLFLAHSPRTEQCRLLSWQGRRRVATSSS